MSKNNLETIVVKGTLTLNENERMIATTAIQISNLLCPSPQIYKLNQVRFVFCIEYFFSIYEETKRISKLDKYGVVEKGVVDSSDLLLLLDKYKKDIGKFLVRPNVQVSAQTIADSFDQKTILKIQRIWQNCCCDGIEAVHKNDSQKLIDAVFSVFNIEHHSGEVLKAVDRWKEGLSYYIIFEEFSSLLMHLNQINPLKQRRNNKDSCQSCSIF